LKRPIIDGYKGVANEFFSGLVGALSWKNDLCLVGRRGKWKEFKTGLRTLQLTDIGIW